MEQPDLGLVERTVLVTGPVRAVEVLRPSLTITVVLDRLPGRAKCSVCGVRRVLFAMAAVGLVQGDARCAKCMGLR